MLVRTIAFNAPSGAKIPFTELGFGAAPIGNLFAAMPEAQAAAALDAAWNAGIRYFDTAPLYGLGLSETRLNAFLRGKPRGDFVISTKVGRLLRACPPDQRTGIGKFFDTPSRREVYDYTHDGVMRSLEDSLERLGLDHVDILYVHDIDVFTRGSEAARDAHIATLMAPRSGGYSALLKLRDQKVVKAIGAGVNEWQAAQILAERGSFDIFLLAGRYTLLEQEALDCFLPLCQQRGIGIVIGGVYNSGILATGAKPGAMFNYSPASSAILERVGGIEAICGRHGVKLVEAALQFPFAQPTVVSVIPGASTAGQIALNMRTLSAGIPPALWTDLQAAGYIRKDAPTPG
jgi:D-threo-aldose 1-dehydrogenase